MHLQTAHFRFYGELNDFLHKRKKEKWIDYPFRGKQAAKDAIEAIGIPHVEVSKIIMNGMPVAFSHHLEPHSRVEVFPSSLAAENNQDLRRETADDVKFILDVHAGALARVLRLLGFDVVYFNHCDDRQIAAIAAAENRVVITRDIGLLKHKLVQKGYWLRSQNTKEQMHEVLRRFNLYKKIKAFERCISCNGLIAQVEKQTIINQLLPRVNECYNEFYQCGGCKKIYWRGSHYDKMNEFVEELMNRGDGIIPVGNASHTLHHR